MSGYMSGNGAAGASYGDLLVTSLIVLGAVCVAAFLVVRLVGRFLTTARSRGADVMTVVARLPLEPRRSLYVVDVAGKTLLVGTSEMGLSLVSELDGAAVHARAAARPSFGELVGSAWQRRRGWTSSSVDGARGAASTSHAFEAGTSHAFEPAGSHGPADAPIGGGTTSAIGGGIASATTSGVDARVDEVR